MRTAMLISSYDLDYLFQDKENIILTYVDDIKMIYSILHINNIDVFVLDCRMFKKNIDLYRAYEAIKVINKESDIYLLIEMERNSLIWLTDFLIQCGFHNFLCVNDFRDIETVALDFDEDQFLIPYDCESGSRFRKRKILKKNKQKALYYKYRFYEKNMMFVKQKSNLKKFMIIALIVVVIVLVLKVMIEAYFDNLIINFTI